MTQTSHFLQIKLLYVSTNKRPQTSEVVSQNAYKASRFKYSVSCKKMFSWKQPKTTKENKIINFMNFLGFKSHFSCYKKTFHKVLIKNSLRN